MRNAVIVVGGGPAGLFQALYLAKVRGRKVIVIEQQTTAGGIMRSAETPWGPADQGAYIFQKCGHAELDALYFDCLPAAQWNLLNGVRRDVAGNYLNGVIETGALFPDLRRLPPADYRRCVDEMEARVGQPLPTAVEAPTLRDYLTPRFGPHAVKSIYEPITRKFWGHTPEDLAGATAAMVHMARIVAYDMDKTMALKRVSGWNAVLGVPDQHAFPQHLLSSAKDCLYPRAHGTRHVLDGLLTALKRYGVELLIGTGIEGIDTVAGEVTGVRVRTQDGAKNIAASAVLWTSGYAPLLTLLSVGAPGPTTPPVPHRVVNLFIDRAPLTGPLYWLWSYDPDTQWTRFTSTATYCPGAAANGLYPTCVETNVSSPDIANDEVVAQVEREIRDAGLIAESAKIIGAYVHGAVKGAFVPSVGNCASLRAQKAAIDIARPRNLIPTGQDVAAGSFFLPDVLLAALPMLDQL